MPTPPIRRLKPPACDSCKLRRVLCHPQPNGAPCPRCAEKNVVCTTTPVPRGRPRKHPVLPQPFPQPQQHPACQASSSSKSSPSSESSLLPLSPTPSSLAITRPVQVAECPELTPQLVAHFFQCFEQLTQTANPLIKFTSITTRIRAVSYQLYLLPPQSRVLALCIIALSSRVSFHEFMLGDGPRPESFYDEAFFASPSNLRGCGARRSAPYHALRTAALKAAWEHGIMLEVSNENAASCFILDLMAQAEVTPSRPWGSAYLSHLRALAPMWRTSPASTTPSYGTHWAGSFMAEACLAAINRKPLMITHEDQLLLCGPAPPTIEAVLTSLESAKPGPTPLFHAMKPYMFRCACLARELLEKISGDNARLSPLSEGAVLQFLASLSLLHTVLSLLLERVDAALSSCTPDPTKPVLATEDGIVRACANAVVIGFVGLALPLHRELEHRAADGSSSAAVESTTQAQARERMWLLRAQAREQARLGAAVLARGSRYLAPVHYTLPMHWHVLRDYAQFLLEEQEQDTGVPLAPERVRDLESIAAELWLVGYSSDICAAPQDALLVERIDACLDSVRAQPEGLFDPANLLSMADMDMFLPMEQWMGTPGDERWMPWETHPVLG